MGTRKSRHNKGRKPLYKEHGGRDSARTFAERRERQQQDRIALVKRESMRPSPNPELEARVAKYLADRKIREAAAAEAEKRQTFNVVAAPKFASAPSLMDLDLVSNRDIALQLYSERKIRKIELHAARMWQHYFEEYTVQPNKSVDWSAPNQKQHWQRDGDLSEPQYRALVVRKIAARALGRRNVQFLDTILEPDMGRADAVRVFGVPGGVIESALRSLLHALSIYFGHCTGEEGDGLDTFREAHADLKDYRLAWAEELHGKDVNLISLETTQRLLSLQDARAHAGA